LQAEEESKETKVRNEKRETSKERRGRRKDRTVVLSIAIADGVDEVSTLVGCVGAKVVLLVAGFGESGVEFSRRDRLVADQVASSSD